MGNYRRSHKKELKFEEMKNGKHVFQICLGCDCMVINCVNNLGLKMEIPIPGKSLLIKLKSKYTSCVSIDYSRKSVCLSVHGNVGKQIMREKNTQTRKLIYFSYRFFSLYLKMG